MVKTTALEFQRKFGEFQHQAQREPVEITRHGRRELVLMSADDPNKIVTVRNGPPIVVGLGAGTMAAYGQEGDYFKFYDINPIVPEFAQKHFTFLEDLKKAGGTWEVKDGDARLSMEQELAAGKPQKFDLIVLDVRAHQVRRERHVVALTRREHALLAFLAANEA